MSDYDYGSDIELTDELHDVLLAAESQTRAIADVVQEQTARTPDHEVMDIEDLVQPSPFEEFKNGYLSVTDLVGTVWCEVQYDYRLRTMPYLPASQRPDKIVSKAGKEIVVDKVKVEDKDRILKRGQVIHERLEREFHVRIELVPETREDVWGLRFLNMLSVLESAIDLGTGRELPVVGFVKDTLVLGVIDEIKLEAIRDDKVDSKLETGPRQTSLTSFYSPSKPKAKPKHRTHKLKVSDSKTRASGTMPRDTDTVAGQLQLMLYKELLDAMLQPNPQVDPARSTNVTMSFDRVFAHLALNPQQPFSDGFRAQSEPIITGNRLRCGAGQAQCLNDMVTVWNHYVELIGLGTPAKGHEADGRTEDTLELVYRRADKKRKSKRKRELSVATSTIIRDDPRTEESDDDVELQKAIALSLQQPSEVDASVSIAAIATAASFIQPPQPKASTTEELEKEEDAIAWEVEMAYRTTGEIEHEGEPVVVHASQETPAHDASPKGAAEFDQNEMTEEARPAKKSGDIIGRHRFKHNPQLLARHLERVMGYWQGTRTPEGVGVTDTRRCGWCEFEEGCEWRLQKAQEALEKVRLRKDKA